MLKLIKHFKPFTWIIVVIFALLFGQAMADLSLPSYMSNIVNIGIQQSGIENAVPQVITVSEFNKLAIFMTDSEKARVLSDYILLDKQQLSTNDYANWVKKYPQLATEPLYKLQTTDKAAITALDTIFVKTIVPVYAIETTGLTALSQGQIQVPSGVDPFVFIQQLPAAQLDAMKTYIQTQTAGMAETLLKGYSVAYLQVEYKAIGLDVNGIRNAYMLRIGGFMLLLTIASAAASVTVGYLSARIAAGVGRNMRKQLFERVENFSNTEFDKFSTASLITRSTNDVTQIQMLMIMLFRIVFYAPIIAIGGILKVVGSDVSMIWIIGAAVGAMLTMILIVFIIALPKFQAMQKLVDKLNLVTREMLTGLIPIRAFNTQKKQEQKFDKANSDLTGTSLFVNRLMVFMMPAMMLVLNGVMLLIVWVGAHQVDAGNMQVGDMMAFMQYAMQIIFAFLMVSIMFIMVPRASVSARRIDEVLTTAPSINDPYAPMKFKEQLKGTVEFRDVSFRYQGAEDDVLKHINFVAKPGQTTAIIGSTGSGKTTLINLIPRFYDVTAGSVLVDGIDVRNVIQHDLRDKIGYVPQKAVLFSGTVESNIRYANEKATAEQVAKYAEISQAQEFITASEEKYDMPVSQGGTNFSGGQKQRLSIARALAKRPEIYIFDDSLSALDYKTDVALRRALKKETSDATMIIVTQRVSTVMAAEQIIVLDDGGIAGIGTHRDLMRDCKVYQEIALSQLSKEELIR